MAQQFLDDGDSIVFHYTDDYTVEEGSEDFDDDHIAAGKVTDAINALPAADKITLENKEAIQAARAAFDALTETQQALVSKDALEKLTAAEDALAKLEAAEADKAAAAKVEETINALPAAADITLENKEAVAAARAAFDALTEAQQALVSKDAQDKLAACEARIAELEKPKRPHGPAVYRPDPGLVHG